MNYFTRQEMSCRCGCGFDTVDFELAEVLDEIREHFGRKVFINSGNRCIKHNEVIQKDKIPSYVPYSSESMHLVSKAADVVVEGVEPIKVYKYLANKYLTKYGIGSYETFTHIDVRSWKWRG